MRAAAIAGWIVAGGLLMVNLSYRNDVLSLREELSTMRRLAERQEAAPQWMYTHNPSPRASVVHGMLRRALGVNGTVLEQVQHDLIQRMGAPGFRWERLRHGPLRPKYASLAADLFVRLHALLFELQLLPLGQWGNRQFDHPEDHPLPRWLRDAMQEGRATGNLERLGINIFFRRYEARVPPSARCLEVDAVTYLKMFKHCHGDSWSLKYQPDKMASPRKPRLDMTRKFVALDLMSMSSAEMAGEAAARFDLIVVQEVFEHIRYPYQATLGLYHLLKPGGFALFTAPFSLKFHLIPGDYFRYTIDGARQLFLAAGFDIVGLHKFGDSAMGTGNDLGFGTGDFTVAHINQSLLQTIVDDGQGLDDGQASFATTNAESLYLGVAVAARRPLTDRTPEGLRSRLSKPLTMKGKTSRLIDSGNGCVTGCWAPTSNTSS